VHRHVFTAAVVVINARKIPSLADARERSCFAVASELLANKGLSGESYAAAEKTMGALDVREMPEPVAVAVLSASLYSCTLPNYRRTSS
jgi:hypothetical protein